MPDLFGDTLPYDHAAQLVEVRREIALRQRVYPGWVKDGRLTQAAADRQLALLQAALVTMHDVTKLRAEQAQEHWQGMAHAAAIATSAGQKEAADTIYRAVEDARQRAAREGARGLLLLTGNGKHG